MFKKHLALVLNRSGPMEEGILGTHTLRKTGYLFALWGVLKDMGIDRKVVMNPVLPEVHIANILGSARHSTIVNAATYQKDSATLWAYVRRGNFSALQNVSHWENILIVSMESLRIIILPTSKWVRPLPELSQYFVEVMLGTKSHKTVSYKHVLQLSLSIVPKIEITSALQVLLSKCVSSDVSRQITEMFQRAVIEETSKANEAVRTEYIAKQARNEYGSEATSKRRRNLYYSGFFSTFDQMTSAIGDCGTSTSIP